MLVHALVLHVVEPAVLGQGIGEDGDDRAAALTKEPSLRSALSRTCRHSPAVCGEPHGPPDLQYFFFSAFSLMVSLLWTSLTPDVSFASFIAWSISAWLFMCSLVR